MAEPVSLQTLLTYLTLISVPVGVFYHIMTLRNTRKNQQMQLETRQIQLYMQFHEKMSTRDFREAWDEIMDEWSWTGYEDFMKKYGPYENPDAWWKFNSIRTLFEQLGILAKEGSVNVQVIYDWLGGTPIYLWDKFEPIIDAMRIEWESPPKGMFSEHFEDLVYVLREIRENDIRDLDNRLRRRKQLRQKFGRVAPDYQ